MLALLFTALVLSASALKVQQEAAGGPLPSDFFPDPTATGWSTFHNARAAIKNSGLPAPNVGDLNPDGSGMAEWGRINAIKARNAAVWVDGLKLPLDGDIKFDPNKPMKSVYAVAGSARHVGREGEKMGQDLGNAVTSNIGAVNGGIVDAVKSYSAMNVFNAVKNAVR